MIKLVSYENIHINGQYFCEQFKLRHQEFIERQEYEVRSYNNMEFDEYDTPAAVYLTYVDDNERVLGASRMTPTIQGCMLADHWPHLVDDKSQLHSDQVWEGTRFCIDKNLPSDLRRKVCYALALGYVEFGMYAGIKKIIGLMPPLILRSVFERSGVFLERLGPVHEVGAYGKVQAAGIPINYSQVVSAQRKTGIPSAIEGFDINNYIVSEDKKHAA
jgi:acyl homoserine lactone synthase